MKLTILTDIPPEFNVARMMAKPGLADFAKTLGGIDSLLDQARRTGNPKACFAISVIGEKGGNYVSINREKFESRILRVNLEGIDSAALFVATCGVELQEWAESFSDFLMRFLAEEICEEALRISIDFLEKKIDTLLGGENLSTMNPGSLEDWPLVEQKPLFRALGDVTGAIRGKTDRKLPDAAPEIGFRHKVFLAAAFLRLPALPQGRLPRQAGEFRPASFRDQIQWSQAWRIIP